MVPREGESIVLPKAAANELRTNVQENSGVRGANREPHSPNERVFGPLYQQQEHRQEDYSCHGKDRERHQTMKQKSHPLTPIVEWSFYHLLFLRTTYCN